MTKCPTVRYMRRYTTLWNVHAQKSPCFIAEWSELLYKTQPFDTVAAIYSSSDVSTIFSLTKDIYSGHTEKPKESPTVRICSNQEERRHDKTLVPMINVQTVTDGVSRRVTSGRQKASLIFAHHEVKVIKGYYRNVMLLITVPACYTFYLQRILHPSTTSNRRRDYKTLYLSLEPRESCYRWKLYQFSLGYNKVSSCNSLSRSR